MAVADNTVKYSLGITWDEEAINKAVEIIANPIPGYAAGGFVPAGKPVVPPGPPEYVFYPTSDTTNTIKYVGSNAGTVTRSLKFTRNGQTIQADVLWDGTIHVDPSAFEMLMEELGFTYADNE